MKSSMRLRGASAALGLGLCLVALPTASAQAQARVQVPCDVTALRNAIIASNSSGADLTLARNCTYTLTDAYAGEDGLPPVTGTYTVNGVGVTIRRASSEQFRILHVAPGARLTLNNVTLVGRQTEEVAGGGILNEGTLSATQVTVRDTQNLAAYGGGIANAGTLSMQRGALTGNSAYLGGGLLNCGGSATLSNVALSHNSASDGGALNNNCSSTLTLNATTVRDNEGRYGGGIVNWTNLVTNGTRITANTAYYGGGLFNVRGTANLSSSRVTENTAFYQGGGIYLAGGAVNLLSGTTVTQNTPDNCYPPGRVTGCSNPAVGRLARSATPMPQDARKLAKVRALLKKTPAIRVVGLD
ncbi:hypothetical protein [Streptomyces sp. NPDC086766]|uniref:hypothetical protein n=1 Tax=Streptomyces sp. NPDC086766 TaxID=3365754 RepID=UPI00382468BF